MMISFLTHSPSQTISLGKRLGHLLEKGDVVALVGELGAGKTTLTTGIAAGLGVKDYVRSPTFTLINEYQGRLPLYHFDLYRLSCLTDLECLGWEEYFYGKGVVVIEWAQKCKKLLPQDHLRIELSPSPSPQRGEGEGEEGEGKRIKVKEKVRQIKIFLPENKTQIAEILK